MTTSEEIVHLTIGKLLRERREEKNLSLKVISHQTKVHIGLLELLENDKLDKLPSKIYVRGFVKATAKVLGLDVKHALTLLDEGYKNVTPEVVTPSQIEHPVHKESLDYFKSLKNSALTSSSLVAKIFIGFIFIAILGVNLKSYLERSTDDTKQKLPTVLTTIHQKVKPVAKPAVPKLTEAQKEEALKVAASMPVNLIQDKKDKTPPPPPIAVVPIKETVIEVPKEEQKKIIDQYLPAKFQILPPKGLHYVFLNAADGDSWVTYKVDNSEIKKFVLRQGRTLFIHGSVVRLFLGNTKTIKMFYNRSYISFKDKGPKNLVYPESLRSQYTEPLFIFNKDGSATTSAP
jgi:cytoskeletal protein RodZ